MTSLKAQTTKGLFWSFLDSFGVYLIKFCFSIFIARTLSPGDYGVMGMIIIFISLGQLLSEGGFAMALVQKKEAAEADYSTVFWFNSIAGIIIYTILFFSAGAIADFFRTPQLTGVTRVAALVIVINALVTVQSVQLARRMEFKKQAVINLVSALFSGTTGIILALRGFGVWALVFQTVAGSIVNLAGLWLTSGWRPVAVFDRSSFRSLASYGYKIFLQGFGDVVFTKIYFPLIGRFFSVDQLGFYSNSNRFYDLFVRQVSSSVNRVVFPAFSSIQEEKERFASNYTKSFGMLAFVMSLLMLVLIISSGQFVEIFLGTKWMPTVPLMIVFFIEGFYFPLLMLNQNLLSALGLSGKALQTDIVKKSLTLISIILTFRYGIKALIIGQVISTFVAFVLSSIAIMKQLGLPAGSLLRPLYPVFLLAAACFLADDLLIDRFITSKPLLLTVKITLIPAIYLVTSHILKVPSFTELRTMFARIYTKGSAPQENG